MRPPKPPASWTMSLAKWGSLLVGAAGILGFAMSSSPENLQMYLTQDKGLGPWEIAGQVFFRTLPLTLSLAGSAIGFLVARNNETLAEEVRLEQRARRTEREAGLAAAPQVSVLMEPEGKSSRTMSTLAWWTGLLTTLVSATAIIAGIAGGIMGGGWLGDTVHYATNTGQAGATTPWHVYGFATAIGGGVMAAVGAAMMRVAGFAGNANTYANARETDKERRQILAKQQTHELTHLQENVHALSEAVDDAVRTSRFTNPQFRETYGAKTRAENLRRANAATEAATFWARQP